mgnify:CR=1 FL=1
MTYETLDVRTDGAVATIFLNRPDKANAMNAPMWRELREGGAHEPRPSEVRTT